MFCCGAVGGVCFDLVFCCFVVCGFDLLVLPCTICLVVLFVVIWLCWFFSVWFMFACVV